MGFKKAVKPEGYENYAMELVIYKQACSNFAKMRLKFKRFEQSGLLTPAQELEWYRAQKKFKEQCIAYRDARAKYQEIIALSKLKNQGIELSALKVADIMGLKIVSSFKDIVEEDDYYKRGADIPEEQFNEIATAAKEYMNRPKLPVREAFQRQTEDKFDPTFGDFEPL